MTTGIIDCAHDEAECPCGCNYNIEHCVYASICPKCSKKFVGHGYAQRKELCEDCKQEDHPDTDVYDYRPHSAPDIDWA